MQVRALIQACGHSAPIRHAKHALNSPHRPYLTPMRNPENLGDRRQSLWCCQCGGIPNTDDHVPSKVFLDEPHPDDLPTVGVCYTCNNGLSKDEVYLATLIECVLRGTTDTAKLDRVKVKKALHHSPALQARIEACRQTGASGETVFHRACTRLKTASSACNTASPRGPPPR